MKVSMQSRDIAALLEVRNMPPGFGRMTYLMP